ncbi:MAG: AsmA family protein [Hahellaceae bacterium]|nr:AsmA family protein [Hahellaceae bacterium]MCP5211014.1 AsmA family protein [Hahellaceae bacterium]
MRAIKYLFLTLFALIAIVIAGLIVLTIILDPNDYKQDIERVAQESGGVNLKIKGDMDWSLYPWLGISIGAVEVMTADGAPFTKLNELQARVNFKSLLSMSPKVQKLVLDGLELNLHKDAEGKANWENVTAKKAEAADTESAPASPASTQQEESTDTDSASTAEAQPISFDVDEVAITNLKVNYSSDADKQSFTLAPLNIVATNIKPDDFFPLVIDFAFRDNQSELATKADISTKIRLGQNFKVIDIKELLAKFILSGKPFNNKSIEAGLAGDIVANLATSKITLSDISASLGNMELKAKLDLDTSGKNPKVDGTLDVAAFSLQELLTQLGQANIATTDPEVLKKIAFRTIISSPDDAIKLNDLSLTLDDTNLKGGITQTWSNGHIEMAFKGDSINVDRYLPPKQPTAQELAIASLKDDAAQIRKGKEQPVEAVNAAQHAKGTIDAQLAASKAAGQATPAPVPVAAADETAPLLPVDTIKGLSLNARFDLNEFIIQKLPVKAIALLITAKDGLVKLEKADGELFEGNFKATASIDARKEPVTWQAHKEINNIQSNPLLKTLADMGILSGGINFKADFTSQGNSIASLKKTTQGQANFFLKEGALEGFNLTEEVCKGIAKVNKKPLAKSDWAKRTAFNDLSGNININGMNLQNPSIIGSLAGVKLSGKGDISVENSALDYQVALTIIGDEAVDACGISPKFKDIPWPIRCQGNFDADPASLCRPDYDAFGEAIEKLAKKEIGRKVDKEVDKLLDKHSDKVDPELQKGIKDLFKGFKK